MKIDPRLLTVDDSEKEWEYEPNITCYICKCHTVHSSVVKDKQYLTITTKYWCKCGHEWEDCEEVG